MKFNTTTSATVLWSYLWWFLSICRGWYVGERLRVSIKNITFGQESVEWVDRVGMQSTCIMIDDVWRRNTDSPAYGQVYCSHRDGATWQYKNCLQKDCILYLMVDIAKRIIWDLLQVAQRNTKLKKAPTRSMSGAAVNAFWQKISLFIYFL